MTRLDNLVRCNGAPACGTTTCPHFDEHYPHHLRKYDGYRRSVYAGKTEYCHTARTRCSTIKTRARCRRVDGLTDPKDVDYLSEDHNNLIMAAVVELNGMNIARANCIRLGVASYAARQGWITSSPDANGEHIITVNQDLIDQVAGFINNSESNCRQD